MNCARFSDGDQHYSCVAREGGRIVVRNPRSPGQTRELSGALTIQGLESRPANAGVMRNASNVETRAERNAMCVEMFAP
jgi:hypothetical protein